MKQKDEGRTRGPGGGRRRKVEEETRGEETSDEGRDGLREGGTKTNRRNPVSHKDRRRRW